MNDRLRTAPTAVFADLIRDADGVPQDARSLKARVPDAERETIDRAWRRAQPELRRHPRIAYEQGRYRWRTDVAAPSPIEALDRLAADRLSGLVRAELVAVVRTAFAELTRERAELAQERAGLAQERDVLAERVRANYREAAGVRAAQDRQARIDAARALAEVAMEVEELAAAGVAGTVTVERVRAMVSGFGLAPIGRAGEVAGFDATRHTPIGEPVPAGSAVRVIRPGYSWHTGDQDVLLARAQIAPV